MKIEKNLQPTPYNRCYYIHSMHSGMDLLLEKDPTKKIKIFRPPLTSQTTPIFYFLCMKEGRTIAWQWNLLCKAGIDSPLKA